MISEIDIRDWVKEGPLPKMEEKKETKEGWKCPVCKTVWAPDVKSCPKCEVKESQNQSGPQLLLENE